MSLRAATGADLADIMAIERASFRGDAWSDSLMEAELASPHNAYVVTVEAGRIVGYAGLRAPAGGTDADIQTIALAADVRGRGRGRSMLRALLAEAAARRMREVFLDVRADNGTAQTLYVSEGFVEVGRRPNYYPDGPTDAIVMRLDLPAWAHAHGDAAPASSEGSADVGSMGQDAPTAARSSDDRSAARAGEWCS